jgi:parvulin-like peptidyl-prolyl isomerase
MPTFHRLCLTMTSCVLLLVACQREPRPDAVHQRAIPEPSPMLGPANGVAAPPSATAAEDEVVPPALKRPPVAAYPRAAWRLAPPSALAPVVLWFSQIVIRHAEARADVSFNLAYWTSVAAPERSRAQAEALAEHVAELAAREPARFAELARQYSEDLPSRDEGGALGGSSAVPLTLWSHVLDALSAVRPGQTSKVVETPYGFHVFYRAEPPPEEKRSGAHIVIGHDRAAWLSVYARGPRRQRTREEALALANDVYQQAKAAPERFAELVQTYSEHRDAIAAGDFGAWSTREPSDFPPRMKRLSELGVGQVGRPIETHLGFEIIQRTPPRPRTQYRAALLQLSTASNPNDAPVDPTPEERAHTLQGAEAQARQLLGDPASFDAAGIQQWEEGREMPELVLALSRLRPGQRTATPVDSENGFLLAQRLEPEPSPAEHFVSDLPTPEPADLAGFLASLASSDTLAFLETSAADAARELSLDSTTADQLRVLHELTDDRSEAEARAAQISALFERTRQLLGSELFARYHALLSRDAAARLLPVDARGPLGL